jgi:hypothetical protein
VNKGNDSPEDAVTGREGFAYDAFASYSTRTDYRIVRTVETFLESFHTRVPAHGLTPEVRLHELELCVDGSDFSLAELRVRGAGPSGDREPDDETKRLIAREMARCRYLLLFCSGPESQTRWTDWELRWFVESRGRQNVFLVVTAGNAPWEDYSAYFSNRVIDEGLQQKIWYDLRGLRGRAADRWTKVRNADDELTRLAADLNGDRAGRILPIWRREEARRQRRQTRRAWTVAVILFVLLLTASGLGVWSFLQGREIDSQNKKLDSQNTEIRDANTKLSGALANEKAERERAELNLARNYLSVARNALEANRLDEALHYWHRAYATGNGLGADFNNLPTLMGGWAGTIKATLPHAAPVHRLSFSPDGRTLGTATSADVTQLWDVPTGRPKTRAYKHDGQVLAIHCLRDAYTVLVVDKNVRHVARVWDSRSQSYVGKPIQQREGYGFSSAAFSPDGKRLCTGETLYATMWDADTGAPLWGPEGHSGQTQVIGFSSDGRTLVVGRSMSTTRDGAASSCEIPRPAPCADRPGLPNSRSAPHR